MSAKRYVLYTTDSDGDLNLLRITDDHEESEHVDSLTLEKASQHGLGHLLNPGDPHDTSRRWIQEAWDYLIRSSLGLPTTEPSWLDRPALTQVTASSPTVLRWFKGMNGGKPYAEQIKPSNFLLLAHPDPLDPSGALPIAPYERDTSKWAELPWSDRRNGESIAVTTEPLDGYVRSAVVRVQTYRDILAKYLSHPEAKSLGPDGKPVGCKTVGLLRRRPVEVLPPVRYIGKEGNRLDERITGLFTSQDEFQTEYVDPSRTIWSEVVVPVLLTMDRATVARAAGVHRRTFERWLYKGVRPHPKHERILTELAGEHAAEALRERGPAVPQEMRVVLHKYISVINERARERPWL